MPNIRLKNIKNFICQDINLEIHDREFLVIWGPTGAGKTTLLNIIAGLIEYEGSVLFDSVPAERLPICMRKVGYLFQNLVLFPHMNVWSNIAFGLHIQGKSRNEIKSRVHELLKLMKIDHLTKRFPKDLSGGEKQRVALARAVAPSPDIMLLDEPLNSLDFNTARYLRKEILQLHKKMGITTLYITHSFDEALALADRIAVLSNGRITNLLYPDNILPLKSYFVSAEKILCNSHQGENKYGLLQIGAKNRC